MKPFPRRGGFQPPHSFRNDPLWRNLIDQKSPQTAHWILRKGDHTQDLVFEVGILSDFGVFCRLEEEDCGGWKPPLRCGYPIPSGRDFLDDVT